MSQTERCTTVYRGRVQGVGFRMTTYGLAQGFDVTGWVRNEPDGSVRMVTEGDPAEVRRFHDAIRTRMDRFVQDERHDWAASDGTMLSFEVRY